MDPFYLQNRDVQVDRPHGDRADGDYRGHHGGMQDNEDDEGVADGFAQMINNISLEEEGSSGGAPRIFPLLGSSWYRDVLIDMFDRERQRDTRTDGEPIPVEERVAREPDFCYLCASNLQEGENPDRKFIELFVDRYYGELSFHYLCNALADYYRETIHTSNKKQQDAAAFARHYTEHVVSPERQVIDVARHTNAMFHRVSAEMSRVRHSGVLNDPKALQTFSLAAHLNMKAAKELRSLKRQRIN